MLRLVRLRGARLPRSQILGAEAWSFRNHSRELRLRGAANASRFPLPTFPTGKQSLSPFSSGRQKTMANSPTGGRQLGIQAICPLPICAEDFLTRDKPMIFASPDFADSRSQSYRGKLSFHRTSKAHVLGTHCPDKLSGKRPIRASASQAGIVKADPGRDCGRFKLKE
jgi:hypothetical protein